MHLVYDSHVLLVDNAKIIGVLWNGKNSEDTLVSLEIGFTKNLAIGYMRYEFEFKDHEYLSLKVVHSGYNAVVQRNRHAEQEAKLVRSATPLHQFNDEMNYSKSEIATGRLIHDKRISRLKEEKRNPSPELEKLIPRGV